MADPLGKIIMRTARRVFIWPLEAGLGLLVFGIARLLVSLASGIMGGLFGLVGPLTPWQGRARRNIQFAMPDVDAEQHRILRGMWRNFGRVIGEFPHVPRLADRGHIEFVGVEHLRDISGGGFMIGAHIGN